MVQYKKVIDYHFPTSKETGSVGGKITEIRDNIISIETQIQDPYTLPEEWKTRIVKVTVNDKTEFTKYDLATGKEAATILSALKVGDQITARTDENIKDKDEFTAKYIELYVPPTE
jgi:hypothetical protein